MLVNRSLNPERALGAYRLHQNMRLKNYREDLLERLKDAEYAAEYLAQVLAENDKAAFLVALKDVVEATGARRRRMNDE